MALTISELFGYSATDESADALRVRAGRICPFVRDKCTKKFSDGKISGVCTVKPSTANPVICCPNRLYAEDYRVLYEVAQSAFGQDVQLVSAKNVGKAKGAARPVVVFGKRWGKELRLPARGKRRAYFVDWILALVDKGGLQEFVAVEVQSIDTTGTYRPEWEIRMARKIEFSGSSKAGLNWENVSKRILPQLIYKGHVLRREPLCRKGLFFVCPAQVYERIMERLGGQLISYPPQPGALTFRWYDLGADQGLGAGSLNYGGQFTTTVDQIVVAFSSPTNLPPEGVYEAAILRELKG